MSFPQFGQSISKHQSVGMMLSEMNNVLMEKVMITHNILLCFESGLPELLKIRYIKIIGKYLTNQQSYFP